jgi:hypothetical protein
MNPANDHERIIARAVDAMFRKDPDDRNHSVQRDCLDVAMALDFIASASDSQFLVSYVNWRLTNAIRSNQDRWLRE